MKKVNLCFIIGLFAVSMAKKAYCQEAKDTAMILQSIKKDIVDGRKTVADVLTDSMMMYLHPLTAFREIMKEKMVDDTVNLISRSEPGIPIELMITISNKRGQPLAHQLIYFYHTDSRGQYGLNTIHVTGMEGDRRHARLFGYAKTNEQGKIVIYTPKPAGYPGSELPAHIHFEILGDHNKAVITELMFDEDARLTEQMRQRVSMEGAYISHGNMKEGILVYQYDVEWPY